MSVQAVQEATASLLQSLQRDYGEAFVNPGQAPDIVRLSDVDAQDLGWVWERWIPARMLTLFGGNAGGGKSSVMAVLIAAWTTGGALPDGAKTRRTNVLMLSAEDDPAFVVRPRLEQHGADARRVFILKGTSTGDGEARRLDLRWDIDVMRQVIRKRRIGVVVIDPLSHYFSKKMWKSDDDEMREALQPLADLVTATGVVTDLARSVLMIADYPDESQSQDATECGSVKVLQVTKSNVSIPPPPLAFRRPLDAPIEWLGESDTTIADCWAAPSASQRGRTTIERDDADAFLTDLLASGPVCSLNRGPHPGLRPGLLRTHPPPRQKGPRHPRRHIRHMVMGDARRRRVMRNPFDSLRMLAGAAGRRLAASCVLCQSFVVVLSEREESPGEAGLFGAAADDYAPLFSVSSKDTKAARIFTLAHKLVHLGLGISSISNLHVDQAATGKPSRKQSTEQWCSAVAAEFLML